MQKNNGQAVKSVRHRLKKPIGTFVAIVFLMMAYCALPERDNPLDPLSPYYSPLVDLQGVVWSFYAPYQGIAGALVSIDSLMIQSRCDEDGGFVFKNLDKSKFLLIASKEGYAPDSMTVDMSVPPDQPISFHLDALPQFNNMSATSQHISRWWPTSDLYVLNIEAIVHDADGPADIDMIFLQWPNSSRLDTLKLADDNEHYAITVSGKNLPIPLADIVGQPLVLMAVDKPGNVSQSVPFLLKRIVNEIPEALSPRGLETTGPSPVLRWQATPPAFTHTFHAKLFRDDSGVVTPVWEQDGIAAGQDTVQVTETLTSGIYFWTISVVDQHGNAGRSKEAAFQVE